MRKPCSEKTSTKLLFDHSAALSETRRDTRVLLHNAAQKLKGQEEKEGEIAIHFDGWLRKNYGTHYDVLHVGWFTVYTVVKDRARPI